MIGERLWDILNENLREPQRAGKITRMLLELSILELLNLLESPDALKAMVSEAIRVLNQDMYSRN